MRILLLVSSLMLSVSVHAAYDKAWYQIQFWSGEWPPGFSVPVQGVHVNARSGMDKDLAANISCELPYKAVFNPWNSARPAEYWTASKIVPLVAKKSFVYKDQDGHRVKIKKGQTIEYLIYNAEGYFSIRINGKEYTGDQDMLKNFKDVPDGSFQEDQWLHITCVGGEDAWILRQDLIVIDKDGNEGYGNGLWNASIGSPGVDDYGHARDLTDDEINNGGH